MPNKTQLENTIALKTAALNQMEDEAEAKDSLWEDPEFCAKYDRLSKEVDSLTEQLEA